MGLSVRDITEGAMDVLDTINPLLTKWSDKQEEITVALLSKGFSKEEIMDYIGVSSNDLEDFIDFELEVRKRMAAKTAAAKKKTPAQ